MKVSLTDLTYEGLIDRWKAT